MKKVIIIGAGLAGSETAWQLANKNIPVVLYEMRDKKTSEAHKTKNFAELVCSNSFRSDDKASPIGVMHQELREMDSLIMFSADKHKVPAGGALAVDREEFSKEITNKLKSHPNITVVNEEFTDIAKYANDENNIIIIATGPLTSSLLSKEIQKITGEEYLNFYDAIAPIVEKDSIDFNYAWYQSRYDKGDKFDYINCGLSEEEYNIFYNELINAEVTLFKDFEKKAKYFEGCLPIEVMATRGIKTLLFGPMKPVGLTDPTTNNRPYAVIQLRQDNKSATSYNIVGFQTKLTYKEQKRVFSLIPALKNANFLKLGSIHKNMFINSPKVLNNDLSLKSSNNIFFAGQITGCEGYIESTAVGFMCSVFVFNRLFNQGIKIPLKSSFNAMLTHILNKDSKNFQPQNINMGLFDLDLFDVPKTRDKKLKKASILSQALDSIQDLKNNFIKNTKI